VFDPLPNGRYNFAPFRTLRYGTSEVTMKSRRSRIPLYFLAAAITLGAGAVDYKVPNKDWGKGPVKWIMTDAEEKAWKGLKTDEERAAFVKTFWEKRDPTPGTPENEYETIFWKKAEAADKQFTTQADVGYRTDKGRVFLLIGGPTKEEKDAKGRTVWKFEPNEITGIKEPFELVFAPGLQTPLLLDRKKLEEYVKAHPETTGIGWKIPVATSIAQGDAEVPAAPTRNPEEDLTPESKRQIPILQALLTAGAGKADVPFQVSQDSYAAVDGTTLTALTIEAPREAAHGSGDVALHPFARLEPSGDGKPVNLTGDLPFLPAPAAEAPPGSFIYQARHNLAPGTYKLAVVVEDKVVPGQSGTLVKTIEVPDYRNKSELNLSSIALLSKFTQLQPGPDEKERGAGPYVLGSYRLVPRAQPVLQKDEDLNFYYQVYNPTPDPATGKPNLEVTVTFYLNEAGAWKRYRPPLVRALHGQVDLYSLALKDLLSSTQKLPADFKMEVKVVDKSGGKEIKRDVPFSVR
jgi:GWxTD domain-containing protein